MATTKITMTLPAPMLKAADRIAAAEYRTRAEVFREALREYIARKSRRAPPGMAEEAGRFMTREEFDRAAASVPLDDEPYTDEERRRVREAEASVARGEYVTLDQFLAEHGNVARRRRKPRK
jgi:predicted transcriptional regulator